ncbi:MAG: cob(I)yrinic acid a,c-diamide adenosyltransferase [Candidatus Marinimicrobia bacterium]|nr:cob(I)yrinic acid a,c-diamide adenosyltransferase [Candidatus Neomarinimicrobiota bacterium]
MCMRITKVYTKTGDDGTTSLAKGERVLKDDPRIAAIGSLDETNSVIGVVLSKNVHSAITKTLDRVQHILFNSGGELAIVDEDLGLVSKKDVEYLESALDQLNKLLPPLKEFILPGGSPAAAQLHHVRTVCRRAERDLVTLHKSNPVNEHLLVFVNRLSDYLFVAARYQNVKDGGKEKMWEK